MNLKEIEEIIKLMNENKLSEIEIEKNGMKIRLKKEDNQIKQVISQVTAEAQAKKNDSGTTVPAHQEQADLQRLIEIKSPMVGTFYRASAPDSDPFVEIGSEVKCDDTLCIIEAMKLMNEIKSEANGRVIEILVENGHSVEYGQTIMLLEPID